ncbi:MAG: DUF4381 domain-containing protein [Burkholderiaceae bacterium]
MSPNDALRQLRDIHLPAVQADEISMPLWVLPLVAMLITAVICVWRRHKRHYLWVEQTRVELRAIEQQAMHARAEQGWQRLAVLMRQLVLLHWPKADVAATTGEDLLRLLDETFETTLFSNGIGRALTANPYRQHPQQNDPQLAQLCRSLHAELERLARQPVKRTREVRGSNRAPAGLQTP